MACCGARYVKVDGEWHGEHPATCIAWRPARYWRFVSPCTGETIDICLVAEADPTKEHVPCSAYHTDESGLFYRCARRCELLQEIPGPDVEVH